MKHETNSRIANPSLLGPSFSKGLHTQMVDLRQLLNHLDAKIIGSVQPGQTHDDTGLAFKIRNIQHARKSRSRLFDPELFADPAWDILLDLFACNLEQRRVSISGLCAASGVPMTTTLRWIGTLEQHGLIARRDDPLDARRVFIMLSSHGLSVMREYFDSLPTQTEPI